MKFLFVVLILFSISVQADEWRTSDTYREVIWQVLNLVDDMQTEIIAHNPNKYEEVGIARTFIGAHPSVDQVRLYFIASAFIHYEISQTLPQGWRDAFQYVTIGIEYDITGKNVQIHGGLKLPF